MPTSVPPRVPGLVTGRARDPIFWNDTIQLLKTVLAAVVAWVLATEVFSLPQSFLAPWAALLVVHATVYRTFSRGLRQVTAAVVGVLLAWAVGNWLGLDTASVVVVLVLGLAIGTMTWFGAEPTAVAATALIVLTTGTSDDDPVLLGRLFDTAIGVGVGLVVNAVVWPPLRRRTAITAMDRIDDGIGSLLEDMGEGMLAGADDDRIEEWVERTRSLDEELDQAWSLVRQARESARMNPRRSAREVRDPRHWLDLLMRMEQAVAETRSMARTLGHRATRRDHWLPAFHHRWATLLCQAGQAISVADPSSLLAARDRLEELADDVGHLPERSAGGYGGGDAALAPWPAYGAVIINLRNILDAMDEVAAVNPLGQPPLPIDRLRWRRRTTAQG